jgi:hypothetical protein
MKVIFLPITVLPGYAMAGLGLAGSVSPGVIRPLLGAQAGTASPTTEQDGRMAR